MNADPLQGAKISILRPSRGIWISLAAISGVMTYYGIDMLLDRDWAGWIAAGIGLPCLLGTLPTLIPGSAYLKLTPEGFVRRIYWLDRAYRWDGVDGFEVRKFSEQRRAVVWNLTDPASRPLRTRLFRAFFGVDHALADGHGMSLEDLAALMNAMRERAVERGQTAGFPLPLP